MDTGISPQVELRLKLIEKDIELLQAHQKEFEGFMKQTQALSFKMNTLEEKIDVLSEQIDKDANQDKTTVEKLLEIGKVVFQIIMIGFVIFAAMNGIKVPGV